MSEHSKIPLPNDDAASAPRAQSAVPIAQSLAWGAEFSTSEHPDTARVRVQRDYITAISALKRESFDKGYAHINDLIDKAKEELGHARSASNTLRRAAMQQHVEELVAYVSGHGIAAKLPNRNGEAMGATLANMFVLEEIPGFLGEIKFAVDMWYEKGLHTVHDEMLKLTGLSARMR